MDLNFGFTLQNLIDQRRVTKEDVDGLRTSLKTPLSDEQLALFILSCDDDKKRAIHTIKKYFQWRRIGAELFSNRRLNDERFQKMLHVGVYAIVSKRTPQNYSILVLKLQDYDYRKFDFVTNFKLILMTLDAITYSDPPDGLICVFDYQGVSFKHATLVKLSVVKVVVRYLQEGLPLKLKEIHAFNAGYAFACIYNVFKPFLGKEFQKLIHLHRSTINFDSFRTTCLAKEFLPEEYGGDLPSILVHHKNTIEKMKSMQAYFEADERLTRDYID
ncbi:hypothetical protein FQR65_LT12551 [Abscondita terminalis]|nr:hypothetical protein FQR65_LT12551 [Abscondita terminalis]